MHRLGGMSRLREIIGPAPSELSYEEFEKRLSLERHRVSAELTEMKNRPVKTRGTSNRGGRRKKPPSLADQAAKMLKARGLSLEDLEEALKGDK